MYRTTKLTRPINPQINDKDAELNKKQCKFTGPEVYECY
jgi:hypothetical protein